MPESGPTRQSSSRPGVHEGLRCLYCHDAVSRKRVACAAGCGASYHPECWEELERCGVDGCESVAVRKVGRRWRWGRLVRLLVVSLVGAGSFVGKAKNVSGHIDRFSARILFPLAWFGGKPQRALPLCTFVFALTLTLNVAGEASHYGVILFVWGLTTLLLSPLGPVFQAVVFGVYSAFRLLLFQPVGWALVVATLSFSRLGERKPAPLRRDPLAEPGRGLFALSLVCFVGGWGVWFWRAYHEQPPLTFGLLDGESLTVLEGMAVTVGGITLVPVALLLAVHLTARVGRLLVRWAAGALEREERLLVAQTEPARERPASPKG